MGGLIVLFIAGVLIVMAIKGSQHDVLPQLFGASNTNTPGPNYQPGGVIPNNPLNPPVGPAPDKNGNCPAGMFEFNGQCYTFA